MNRRVMIMDIDDDKIRIDGCWGYWGQRQIILDLLGSAVAGAPDRATGLAVAAAG